MNEFNGEFRPLENRILVRQDRADEKTKGGLFIPESAKKKPLQGTVIATGPGITLGADKRDCLVNPGDHVLFEAFAGTDIILDDDPFLLLNDSDVLGVVEYEQEQAKAA